MSNTEILEKMLHSCSLIPLKSYVSKNNKIKYKICLTEAQTQNSFFEIYNLPVDAFVIDLDKSFNNQKLFKGNAGECKRADYMIISESYARILFIEMKQSSDSATDITYQLRGALCVFEYYQIIAREFFKIKDFINFEKRFIALMHTNAKKNITPSKDSCSKANNHPDNYFRVFGRNSMQFNALAA